MTLEELQNALAQRVNDSALQAFNGHISLHCYDPGSSLHLELDHGELRWHQQPGRTDATFYFDDCDHALALLTGKSDVMTEFMAGRFRSSGYLRWAFPVLGLFTGGST